MGFDTSKVDKYNVTNETFVKGKQPFDFEWKGRGLKGIWKKNPGASFFRQNNQNQG